MSKTVPLFRKRDTLALRLAGHVLVTIQDDLGSKGRMPRHLDRYVPPIPVQNVKAVVLHVRLLRKRQARRIERRPGGADGFVEASAR
jgi:hypothetical protein